MMTRVNPFSIEMPRAIHFGAGALERLLPLAGALGRRPLLVTGGSSFDASKPLSRLSQTLPGVHRLRCRPGEPSEGTVDEAAAEAASFQPDVIVAVGGGSVLDTAKALSILCRNPGPCARFLEGTPGASAVPGPGIPWIAVPTTAGTGSEATKNAVIRSQTAGAKRSMRSAFLLAHAVIVDPLLTVSLPASVTGASGLDALTQLVEAYLCRNANPLVSSLVEGAFPGMLAALEGLAADPASVEHRTAASYGALVSGIALANAGLGAAHGFAAAVGAFHVPHGLACAVFLPHVLAANAGVIGPGMVRLAATCGMTLSPPDAVAWLAARVRALLSSFGLPHDLRGYEIPRAAVPELAEKSMGSSMRGNPREMSAEERASLLSAVL
jgi:alcohol dehydrogenase class IV